jgi:hypothetical protein
LGPESAALLASGENAPLRRRGQAAATRGTASEDETHPMRLQRRGFSLLRVALPCFSTRESAKRGGRAFRSCRIFRSRSGAASLVEHRPQEGHAAMREAVADSRRAWLRREIDPAAAAQAIWSSRHSEHIFRRQAAAPEMHGRRRLLTRVATSRQPDREHGDQNGCECSRLHRFWFIGLRETRRTPAL